MPASWLERQKAEVAKRETMLLRLIAKFEAKLERHDAAEALHLALRKRVLRMRRQPRVEHPRDFRVLFEVPRDSHGIGAMPLHAQRKCLEPQVHEPAIERAG